MRQINQIRSITIIPELGCVVELEVGGDGHGAVLQAAHVRVALDLQLFPLSYAYKSDVSYAPFMSSCTRAKTVSSGQIDQSERFEQEEYLPLCIVLETECEWLYAPNLFPYPTSQPR